jgi:hypothetical protein
LPRLVRLYFKFKNDLVFKGKPSESIRILNSLADEADLDLAVYTALKIAYSNEKSVGGFKFLIFNVKFFSAKSRNAAYDFKVQD